MQSSIPEGLSFKLAVLLVMQLLILIDVVAITFQVLTGPGSIKRYPTESHDFQTYSSELHYLAASVGPLGN